MDIVALFDALDQFAPVFDPARNRRMPRYFADIIATFAQLPNEIA